MRFEVTFDYLCPFARNLNEAVVAGMAEGRGWEPAFRAFSLAQVHVEDGPDVWDAPAGRSGVLALQWGIAVRDRWPQAFPAAHLALFAARHDHGRDINDERVLAGAVAGVGVDPDEVAAAVASGAPAATLGEEHMRAVAEHSVFGVPTLLVGDEAVFVRLMTRGSVDDLQRALDLVAWTDLNEFKRTSIPR